MSDRLLGSLGRVLRSGLRAGVRSLLERSSTRGDLRRPGPARPTACERGRASASGYPGDFEGMPQVAYAPLKGNEPDPGEVVWTWVPYEEDHTRGKDRPVLLVGRDGPWLLGLQMTSVDHDRDSAQEARAGRFWVEVGAGAWDRDGRVSEVRVNRVLRIDPDAVRRVSVALPRPVFDRVVDGMRRHLS